ncbi:hypothetical protein GCM10017781_07800 [Deinococcus metalli]|uniref:DUF3108 domain-containing protein n=2 Tax=Deinococcus metalli TaxID=1141878 RepID=A0ABQ3JIA2_9DEIO|nr:hypothetical protein GCM10017781_07800 [Deinococcus metalli]
MWPPKLCRMSGPPPLLAALALALLLPALGSCAPRATTTTVQSSTPVTGVSFYPHEAGLTWSYAPEGEAGGAPPYVLRGLGATVYGSQAVQAEQLTGRGAEQTWYRTYDAAGVHLYGLNKPGVNVQLTPPWLEYPAENAWRVGLSWEGQSQVTIRAADGTVQGQGTLTYRYLVQDRRSVQTPAGTFDVWVVTRQISDTLGGLFPATQQVWFTPFVGEVRTPEGLLLTARNFAARPGGQP